MRKLDYAERVQLVWGCSDESGAIRWGAPESCRLDSAIRSVVKQWYKQPNKQHFIIIRADKLKAITAYKTALAVYERPDFPMR